MASSQQSSSSSSSYYPVDINPLINSTIGNVGGVSANIGKFLNNPLSGELFQGTIGPLLQALQGSEESSRTALADQFRIAGGGQGGALQSGAFAQAARQNERNILDNRSRVVATQANDVFRNILSGLGLQLNAAEAPGRLLGNIRPLTQSSSQSSGSSTDPVINSSPGGSSSRGGSYSGGGYSGGGLGAGGGQNYNDYGYDLGGGVDYGDGGGYGVIYNPYSGAYESNPFTGFTSPYDHEYGDWQDAPVDNYEESFF